MPGCFEAASFSGSHFPCFIILPSYTSLSVHPHLNQAKRRNTILVHFAEMRQATSLSLPILVNPEAAAQQHRGKQLAGVTDKLRAGLASGMAASGGTLMLPSGHNHCQPLGAADPEMVPP